MILNFLTRYPLLTKKGAFSPTEIYTYENVKSIVSYAKNLGIRVIPEFDFPGHSLSWGKGYPELLVPGCNVLNPITNYTYELIEGFLTEMSTLFPDNYIHLGGDEVNDGCWINNTDIRKWMQEHNIVDFAGLEQYFSNKLLEIGNKLGKVILNWQEIFDNGIKLPSNGIVEVWKTDDIKTITAENHYVISSYKWYLNHWCNLFGDGDWSKFYANNLLSGLTPEEKQLVLGGETTMWNACVDETNFMPTVWPRTSATAARLWVGIRTELNTEARMTLHRCRLIERGINAAPIGPGTCYQ